MELHCRLDEIIKEEGRSQKWLAEKTGVSMATISLLKQNKRLPTLPVAIMIAKTLGVPVENIWFEAIKKGE